MNEARHMQVNCSKCSRPITLTDVIELFEGHLAHVDCKRAQGLTPEERAVLFVFCSSHPVAHCLPCGQDYRFTELAADILGGGRTNLCPRCRRDLTESVRAHVFSCVQLPSELRQRAQNVRDAAQILIKRSQERSDSSDVLIREAEVNLAESQRALRAAMARRQTS
jgi:hypothetical protein